MNLSFININIANIMYACRTNVILRISWPTFNELDTVYLKFNQKYCQANIKVAIKLRKSKQIA